MSDNYKVPLTEILEINPHSGADRLEFVKIYGYDVIVKKGSFNIGDKIIYIPIDSILPSKLEYHLFPPDSKIKLHKSRVRQIKIRGLVSQGMIITLDDINRVYGFTPAKLESDFAEKLQVTKYEPPTRAQKQGTQHPRKKKPLENSSFHKYNGLTNLKWCPHFFRTGEPVVIQEKLHGSNCRASKMPFQAHTLWQKIKGLFGKNPKFEFCYGSNNIQLQNRKGYTGYYGEDHFGETFKKIDAESKIKDGEAIYGELIGEGIQKNYHYGHKNGDKHFVLFDVKVLQDDGTQKWLLPKEVEAYGKERGFDVVPTLFRGNFSSIDECKVFAKGNSIYCPEQKVIEGVVIKSAEDYNDPSNNKRGLKLISEAYLSDKSNTDFH